MPVLHCDVAVIGAGPAGSALARRLALLGHDVVLCERRTFSRPGYAESLTLGVHVHLTTLGIELSEAWPVATKLVRWGGEVERIEAPSLVVDRAAFDQQLLDAARDAGVRVLQPFDRIGDIEAKFLADASGRAGLLRVPRTTATPSTFAWRMRWNEIDAPPEMRIATLSEGWAWGVPAGERSYHACVFTDKDTLRSPLSALRSDPLFDFLTKEPDLLHACVATPHVAETPITASTIVVGDAACAIDPLSSSGIQSALGGAIAGSIAVNTILRAPERTQAAIDFYSAHVRRVASRHGQWTAAHYTSASPRGTFWQARTRSAPPAPARPMPRPTTRIALHPQAACIEAPVIAGDLIELRRVLRTPDGEHVAYVGGNEVAPLVESARDGMTAAELARSWPLPPREAVGVLQWLVAHDVVRCQ